MVAFQWRSKLNNILETYLGDTGNHLKVRLKLGTIGGEEEITQHTGEIFGVGELLP